MRKISLKPQTLEVFEKKLKIFDIFLKRDDLTWSKSQYQGTRLEMEFKPKLISLWV